MRNEMLTLVVLAALLAACAAPEHLEADFGNSNRINIAAQLANPGAALEARDLATGDGQKAEQALKDYRQGGVGTTRDHLILTTSTGG